MSDSKMDTEAAELDLDAPTDVEAALREAMEAVEQGTVPGETGYETPEGSDLHEGEVRRLRREIADLRDRSMRTLADFDNFRKRSDRERQDAGRYAAIEPLRDFLEVADNLERALSAGGSADDLKLGVGMIFRQIQDLLRRHGVREISAAGASFDPAVHEAVSREESAEVELPTVVAELQRGYFLHERLLRPARVKVAVPAEPVP
jgi:molecular chaperone GrpE